MTTHKKKEDHVAKKDEAPDEPEDVQDRTLAASPTDWEAMLKMLSSVVSDRLRGVLDGADADIKRYADALATSLALAIQRGRVSMAEEIEAQARVLLAINRIRASRAARDVLHQILSAIIRTALAVGVAALKQTPPETAAIEETK